MTVRAGAPAWAALLPAIVVLLCGDGIFLEQTVLSEPLFIFLSCAALYSAVRTDDSRRAWAWGATAGLLLGGLFGVWLAPVALGDASPSLMVSLGALFIVILAASLGQGLLQWGGARLRDQITWQPARARAAASSCWLPTRRRETTLAISRCRSGLPIAFGRGFCFCIPNSVLDGRAGTSRHGLLGRRRKRPPWTATAREAPSSYSNAQVWAIHRQASNRACCGNSSGPASTQDSAPAPRWPPAAQRRRCGGSPRASRRR